MGHNVNVMGGVDVSDGAVVAAGAVVTKPVPPHAIVVGFPARIVRYRFIELTIERLLAVRWWEFKPLDLAGLNFRDVAACLPRLDEMSAQQGAICTTPPRAPCTEQPT